MMKLCGVLALLSVFLSTAYGLRCYTCTATDPRSCTDTKSCAVIFNRCFSLRVEGYQLVTKGCQTSMMCGGAMECCEGNLCNSARLVRPSVLITLIFSFLTVVFLPSFV